MRPGSDLQCISNISDDIPLSTFPSRDDPDHSDQSHQGLSAKTTFKINPYNLFTIVYVHLRVNTFVYFTVKTNCVNLSRCSDCIDNLVAESSDHNVSE